MTEKVNSNFCLFFGEKRKRMSGVAGLHNTSVLLHFLISESESSLLFAYNPMNTS